MGYEKCGRPEVYPYGVWLDGGWHTVPVPEGLSRDSFIRALRYGARRYGKRLQTQPTGLTAQDARRVRFRALASGGGVTQNEGRD